MGASGARSGRVVRPALGAATRPWARARRSGPAARGARPGARPPSGRRLGARACRDTTVALASPALEVRALRAGAHSRPLQRPPAHRLRRLARPVLPRGTRPVFPDVRNLLAHGGDRPAAVGRTVACRRRGRGAGCRLRRTLARDEGATPGRGRVPPGLLCRRAGARGGPLPRLSRGAGGSGGGGGWEPRGPAPPALGPPGSPRGRSRGRA